MVKSWQITNSGLIDVNSGLIVMVQSWQITNSGLIDVNDGLTDCSFMDNDAQNMIVHSWLMMHKTMANGASCI